MPWRAQRKARLVLQDEPLSNIISSVLTSAMTPMKAAAAATPQTSSSSRCGGHCEKRRFAKSMVCSRDPAILKREDCVSAKTKDQRSLARSLVGRCFFDCVFA